MLCVVLLPENLGSYSREVRINLSEVTWSFRYRLYRRM